MVSANAYLQAAAGKGPLFVAFLIPHIVAGMAATASGAIVLISGKGTRRHVRVGTVYYWAIGGLAVTAAGLTVVRGVRDLYLLVLGVIALALASTGRHVRRHPLARPWRAWPGHAPHILAMATSYTVMLTAFYVDNGKRLPLVSHLPTAAFWLLPAAIAAPLIARSLYRHRRRPAPGPAPAAAIAAAASTPDVTSSPAS
jgi:uncharacterized membrane protein